MSDSTAIGMVSESLRNLLNGELSVLPTVPVTVLAPDEGGGDRRINLFLYKVQENTSLRNTDWQVKPGDPTKITPPPLFLNLYYLLTVYAKNDSQTGNSNAHAILGDAMRVFFENPIIPDTYLVEGLKTVQESLKIMLNSVDLDELSRIWSTFTQPFRLSVLYEVSIVQLDPLAKYEQTMAKRVQTIGVPVVRAPYHPPSVDSISPLSGHVNDTITCTGTGLSGWKAYVYLGGRALTEGLELDSDSFTVTVPDDMPTGFYELRIDISHLFRRIFFYEVCV